jgi:hypothetical protein
MDPPAEVVERHARWATFIGIGGVPSDDCAVSEKYLEEMEAWDGPAAAGFIDE